MGNMSTICITRSLGGGTGSGLGSRLLEAIRDEFGNKVTILDSVVYPFSTGDTPTQYYNTVLSLASSYHVSDGIFFFDNDDLLQQARRQHAQQNSLHAGATPSSALASRLRGGRIGGARGNSFGGTDSGIETRDVNAIISTSLALLQRPVRYRHRLPGRQVMDDTLGGKPAWYDVSQDSKPMDAFTRKALLKQVYGSQAVKEQRERLKKASKPHWGTGKPPKSMQYSAAELREREEMELENYERARPSVRSSGRTTGRTAGRPSGRDSWLYADAASGESSDRSDDDSDRETDRESDGDSDADSDAFHFDRDSGDRGGWIEDVMRQEEKQRQSRQRDAAEAARSTGNDRKSSFQSVQIRAEKNLMSILEADSLPSYDLIRNLDSQEEDNGIPGSEKKKTGAPSAMRRGLTSPGAGGPASLSTADHDAMEDWEDVEGTRISLNRGVYHAFEPVSFLADLCVSSSHKFLDVRTVFPPAGKAPRKGRKLFPDATSSATSKSSDKTSVLPGPQVSTVSRARQVNEQASRQGTDVSAYLSAPTSQWLYLAEQLADIQPRYDGNNRRIRTRAAKLLFSGAKQMDCDLADPTLHSKQAASDDRDPSTQRTNSAGGIGARGASRYSPMHGRNQYSLWGGFPDTPEFFNISTLLSRSHTWMDDANLDTVRTSTFAGMLDPVEYNWGGPAASMLPLRSLTQISHSDAFITPVLRAARRCEELLHIGAYIHWYERFGCEKQTILQSLDDVLSVIESYR